MDQSDLRERVSCMRTSLRPLLLIVISLVAASTLTAALLGATPGTANACSYSTPILEVTPSSHLTPGQTITVTGRYFHDALVNEAVDSDDPQAFCDFTFIPQNDLRVVWSGVVTTALGVANGPEFSLVVSVPLDAAPGTASIGVDRWQTPVSVGQPIKVPDEPMCLSVDRGCSPCLDGTSSFDCHPCPSQLTADTANATLDHPQSGCAQPPVGCQLVGGDAVVCPQPCPDPAQAAPSELPPPCRISTPEPKPPIAELVTPEPMQV